jgi:hypothetical protein
MQETILKNGRQYPSHPVYQSCTSLTPAVNPVFYFYTSVKRKQFNIFFWPEFFWLAIFFLSFILRVRSPIDSSIIFGNMSVLIIYLTLNLVFVYCMDVLYF